MPTNEPLRALTGLALSAEANLDSVRNSARVFREQASKVPHFEEALLDAERAIETLCYLLLKARSDQGSSQARRALERREVPRLLGGRTEGAKAIEARSRGLREALVRFKLHLGEELLRMGLSQSQADALIAEKSAEVGAMWGEGFPRQHIAEVLTAGQPALPEPLQDDENGRELGPIRPSTMSALNKVFDREEPAEEGGSDA